MAACEMPSDGKAECNYYLTFDRGGSHRRVDATGRYRGKNANHVIKVSYV